MDENQFLALQKRATQNREDVPISLSDIGGSSVDFIGRAEAPVDKAFSDYLKTVQGFAKPLDLYQRGEQAAGIPEMRQTATTLRGQIADIEDILYRYRGAKTGYVGSLSGAFQKAVRHTYNWFRKGIRLYHVSWGGFGNQSPISPSRTTA